MLIRQQPIFLLGSQRSGSTALGMCLSKVAQECGGSFTVNGKLLYYLKRWWIDDPTLRHARADEVLYSLKRRMPLGPNINSWMLKVEQALRRSAGRIADGSSNDLTGEVRQVWHECYGTVG